MKVATSKNRISTIINQEEHSMKTNKLLIISLFCIALMSVGCQVDEPEVIKQFTIRAVIGEETKVSYVVNNHIITPSWVQGDAIFGFDDQGNTFTFTANGDGRDVTFSIQGEYSPTGATTLYAIYAPGYDVDDFSGTGNEKTLSINLAKQGGVLDDGSIPAIMCAKASVDILNNEIKFSFSNQTAIIGVEKFQINGAPSGTKVDAITLNGVKTKGEIKIVGDEFKLVPSSEPVSSITAPKAGDGKWTTEENGICKTSVYFAAIPTENAKLVLNATVGETEYANVSSIDSKTLDEGRYYHMSKILDEPVAKIGDVYYGTIDEAFAAANNSTVDATITLLKDCSTSNQLLIDNSGTVAVTLDLNGKSITFLDNGFGNSYVRIEESSVFTITDDSDNDAINQGTIETSSSTYVVYCNRGKLFINGGNIVNKKTGGHALYIDSNESSIDGGKIESLGTSIYFFGTNNSDILRITGGSVNSGSYSISCSKGRVDISDGYFSSTNSNQEIFEAKSNGIINVAGGYYDRPVINGLGNNALNVLNDEGTKEDYPFKISSSGSTRAINSVNSATYLHATLGSAIKHAQTAHTDITIQLQIGIKTYGLNLTNENGKRITLDLNDYTISTTNTSAIITTTGKLTIDGGTDKKGTIWSSYYYVVIVNGTEADVTISNCTIYSTNTATRDTYTYPAAVYLLEPSVTTGKTNSELTISGATIYTTNSLTAVSNRNGNLTIDGDSEISSGTAGDGDGIIAVSTGDNTSGNTDRAPSTTIKSGIFYSSNPNTGGTRPAVYLYGSNSSLSIEGGYFYSEGTRSIRAGSGTTFKNITVKGGYYNNDLSYDSNGKTYDPTYAEGFEKKSDISEKKHHSIINKDLEFTFAVGPKPSQEAIPTPSEEPVASLGSAIPGGITF